nr:alpha-glucosidase [Enterococcus sp. 9E7_DIV0242]
MAKEWWKESIVYQIYPKSFQDSNNDGIGDLQGIKKRLSYLNKLGIDVIWLSPIYQSPMIDGGYDISDYQAIDPMFGTMADMDELIQEADRLGIKLLMDLVVNHTSSEHSWFKEALSDSKSKYRDYYIFREGIDGQPPNNWRSYFGGSAWTVVPNEENMYYLHAFAAEQPDLNWENSEVREEIITMINWWLDKGLGGFRIDAILNLKKKIEYGKFEPDGEDGLVYIGHWILNQPGIEVWLKELDERTFKKHNSLTVAEADVEPSRLHEYIGDEGVFRMIFDFTYTDIDVPGTGEWHKQSNWTVSDLKEAIFTDELETQAVGWGAKYLENHDQPRSINKYIPEADISDVSKKMLATLFMMLHGTPFIYQGQELGMENIQMDRIEDYDDIASHDQYNRAVLSGILPEEAFQGLFKRSRDNSRTPMQWSIETNAGFSKAEQTWLPVNPNHLRINAEQEEKQSDSVLNYYRQLIHLRKESKYKETIVYGEFVPLELADDTIIAYKRVYKEQEIVVLINFSDQAKTIDIVEGMKSIILSNVGAETGLIKKNIHLAPYAGIIAVNE